MSAPEGGGGGGGRNPLERTNIPFGGVINDIKYRYRHYWSDIKVFNQLGYKGLFSLNHLSWELVCWILALY